LKLSENSSPDSLPAEQAKQPTAACVELAQDEKTRKLMEARRIYEVDRKQERDYARKEGRVEERLEIAKKLLLAGDSPEKISQVTGLDIEAVRKL